MRRTSGVLLALVLCALLATCSGCAGYVQTPAGWELTYALGQSEVEVLETPGGQVCVTSHATVTPAAPGRRLIYSSAWSQPQTRCQTVDAGRRVTVKGGPISAALAWLTALVFTNGAVGAIP